MLEIKNIIKGLEQFQRFGAREVYEDLVDFMFALCCAECKVVNMAENGEDIFNRIKEKYGDKDLLKLGAIAGEAIQLMLKTQMDVLGSIYMQTAPKRGLGQVFTPDNICDAMVQLCEDEAAKTEKENTSYCDPCCGSGAMMLAKIRNTPLEKLLYVDFYLNDLDILCTKQAAIQMAVQGVSAVITNGNTLLKDTFAPDYDGIRIYTKTYRMKHGMLSLEETMSLMSSLMKIYGKVEG